jgi:hypothetical protein
MFREDCVLATMTYVIILIVSIISLSLRIFVHFKQSCFANNFLSILSFLPAANMRRGGESLSSSVTLLALALIAVSVDAAPVTPKTPQDGNNLLKVDVMRKTTYVTAGDNVWLKCQLNTTVTNVTFTWFKLPEGVPAEEASAIPMGAELTPDQGHFKIFSNAKRSMVLISKVTLSDHGVYRCRASSVNAINEPVTETTLRVASAVASLYPLLAILVELFIVFTCICLHCPNPDEEKYGKAPLV